MMKFLMAITLVVKLDMDFVILSKLRSQVSLVGVFRLFRPLFISGSVSKSTTSFSILF